MDKIFLFPCNGNAIEAIDCLGDHYYIEGFIDDSQEKQNQVVLGHKVYSRDILSVITDAQVLAVPGSPSTFLNRIDIIDSLRIPQEKYLRVIHQSASMSRNAIVGFNTLIMAGVVVTGNAKIGNHVCILPNTVIHHDVVIGDYTLIGSNVTIAGFVNIGENSYIGSSVSIKNSVTIGDKTIIGMASNVVKSIPSRSVAYGNPAKVKVR